MKISLNGFVSAILFIGIVGIAVMTGLLMDPPGSDSSHRQRIYDDQNFFGEIHTLADPGGESFEHIKKDIQRARGVLKETGLAGNVCLVKPLGGETATKVLKQGKVASKVFFRYRIKDGRTFAIIFPSAKLAIKERSGPPTAHFVFNIHNSPEYGRRWWFEKRSFLQRRLDYFVNDETIFQATVEINRIDINKYLKFY